MQSSEYVKSASAGFVMYMQMNISYASSFDKFINYNLHVKGITQVFSLLLILTFTYFKTVLSTLHNYYLLYRTITYYVLRTSTYFEELIRTINDFQFPRSNFQTTKEDDGEIYNQGRRFINF